VISKLGRKRLLVLVAERLNLLHQALETPATGRLEPEFLS
jgi:hypothetical protein